MGGESINDRMRVVADRVEFLEALDADGPLAPRTLEERVDASRSTVTRAVRELREAGLAAKDAGGYDVTPAGALAYDAHERYERTMRAISDASDLLEPLPVDETPPVDVLVGARTTRAESAIPVRAVETVSDHIRTADRVRVYLPTLVDTHLLRVWHRAVVSDACESTALLDPELSSVLKGQYPELLGEMAATDNFTVHETTGPPFGLVVTSDGDETRVALLVYEESGGVRGLLTNDGETAVDWAARTLDRLRDRSTDVTADVESLIGVAPEGASTVDPTGGGGRTHRPTDRDASVERSLPLSLDTEGFVRLSPTYFEDRTTAPPAVSWRSGFTLAEVCAGHAFERRTEDGDSLTSSLLEGLETADDHVVLGPPGSGKSTVCKAVACEWYERDRGPVFYRERGTESALTSTELLEATLRRTSNHALVVVEDAVRAEANAVFEVACALADDPSVSFLFDARRSEWHDERDHSIPPRADEYRRSAVETVSVPNLDERDCERLLETFDEHVDVDSSLTGSELYDLVQDTSTDSASGDETAVGDVLIAQHHLTRRLDPTPPTHTPSATSLEKAAEEAYQRYATADEEYVLDAAVLVNVLNVAGLPVAREFLYVVAPVEEFDAVDDARRTLSGNVLFAPSRTAPSGAPLRTRHETWSRCFLSAFANDDEMAARERFGRLVTRLLALADDPEVRRAIQRHLDGRTPHVHQLESDPEHWTDLAAARLFNAGHNVPSLAPLFGATNDETIELPDAASPGVVVQQAFWRGEMYRLAGDLDAAEREFRTLVERADAVDFPDETVHEPAVIDWGALPRTGRASTVRVETLRTRWHAIGHTKLGRVADMRGDLERAATLHERAHDLCRDVEDSHLAARIRNNQGIVAYKRGATGEAAEYYADALSLRRELDDRYGETRILLNLGLVASRRGDLATAEERFEESLSLCRDLGDRNAEATVRKNLGNVAYKRGDLDEAANRYEESEAIERDLGDKHGLSCTLLNLGFIAAERGDLDAAESYYADALAMAREIGNAHLEAKTLNHLGVVARRRGDLDEASSYQEEGLDLARDQGARGLEAAVLGELGRTARERGDLESAASYHEQSLAIEREVGDDRGEAESLHNLAVVARERGDLARAAEYDEDALDRFRSVGDRRNEAIVLDSLGLVARERGDLDRARSRFEEATELCLRNDLDREATTDAFEYLIDCCERQGDEAAAVDWCERATSHAAARNDEEMRDRFSARREELEK